MRWDNSEYHRDWLHVPVIRLITGVKVESCNGVMKRQFLCLWTASAQREDASFDTWPLSWAPQKWMVRIIRTTMAVDIVTFRQLFQEWQPISTPCEPSLKYIKRSK